MQPKVLLPAEWNEASIMSQLQLLRDQRPALIPHLIESVKERWILRQDDRTAATRLQFLKSQVEKLRLAKDFQQLRDDLDLLLLEKRKRIKTLELEMADLDGKTRTKVQLDELTAQRERKKMELEIAQLDQQIEAVKNPAKVVAESSPEQRRAQEKKACEQRIATLKADKQAALKLDDEAERVLRVNAIDDALQREYERWAKLL